MSEPRTNILLPFSDSIRSDWQFPLLLLLGVLAVFALLVCFRRFYPNQHNVAELIGEHGIALTVVAHAGMVRVQGEIWKAHANTGIIAIGKPVIVIAQNGMVLEVQELK